LYSDSTRSTVSLNLSSPNGSFDNNACGGTTPFDGGPYAPLFSTLISTAASSANGYVDLTGLSPNAVYNLYVYSAGNAGAGGRSSTFTVGGGGGSQTSTWTGTDSTLISGDDYLEFAGVTAD